MNTIEPSRAQTLPVIFETTECDPDHARRILDAAISILLQGETLLGALDDATYSRRVPVVFNASVGGHYRHCLDHFSSLMLGLDSDQVDYDHRKRDPRVETQTGFACELTADLRATLEALAPETLCAHVQARCEVSYAHGDSPVMNSTFGRELAYCVAHAIHHYALIAVMARLMEIKLPDDFGVAPSTMAHQHKLAGNQRA